MHASSGRTLYVVVLTSYAGLSVGAFDIVAPCGYNEAMKAVGIRELKNRLSGYVRDASQGELILVTDRGMVVAELGPPTERATAENGCPAGLLQLARQGRVRLGEPNRAELYSTRRTAKTSTRAVRMPAGTVQRLIDEDREDR